MICVQVSPSDFPLSVAVAVSLVNRLSIFPETGLQPEAGLFLLSRLPRLP
jgi:hypothetical protein